MPSVSSSNISAIDWDSEEQKAVITFHDGDVYDYEVSHEDYERILAAVSKGKYFWRNWRGWRPGHVIDKPWKETPGGVGGALVPYGKRSGYVRTLSKKGLKGLLSEIEKKKVGALKPRS